MVRITYRSPVSYFMMMAITTTFIGQASTRHLYDWPGQGSGRTDRENIEILTHLLKYRNLLDTLIVAAGNNACSLYNHCMREVNGQVTDLNPRNEPILRDLMTYANEARQESIKEISQQYSVSNYSRLYIVKEVSLKEYHLSQSPALHASRVAAFLYSLDHSPNGVQFADRFNEKTKNYGNVLNYPYCPFYMALFRLPPFPLYKKHIDISFRYFKLHTPKNISIRNAILVRGGIKDDLKMNVNDTFQFGQFTSFSANLTVASTQRGKMIIVLEENKLDATYARIIKEFDTHHEEYLIDPVSKFRITQKFESSKYNEVLIDGNRISVVYVIESVKSFC